MVSVVGIALVRLWYLSDTITINWFPASIVSISPSLYVDIKLVGHLLEKDPAALDAWTWYVWTGTEYSSYCCCRCPCPCLPNNSHVVPTDTSLVFKDGFLVMNEEQVRAMELSMICGWISVLIRRQRLFVEEFFSWKRWTYSPTFQLVNLRFHRKNL